MLETVKNYNQHQNIRSFLNDIFEESRQLDNKFSLRAYSHKLQIDASSLSKMLKGKREISFKTFSHISEKLNLPVEVQEHFKETDFNDAALNPMDAYTNVSLDSFKIISEWFHYAILELTYLADFKSDVEWIAQKLSIEKEDVEQAINRLLKTGLLAEDENGRYYDTQKSLTTMGNTFTSEAFKSLQRDILLKAIEAMNVTPMAQRSQSSMTLAVDSSKLPIIQKKINKFRRELTQYIESTNCESKDSVYNLSISFYPIVDTEEA